MVITMHHPMANKVTPKELQEGKEEYTILGVQEAEKLDECKIGGAVTIPLGRLIRKARHGEYKYNTVQIKENLTGILEEMADVGVGMNKAEDKTEQMKAKAQALDEMIDSGALTDYTSNRDDIESELEK